MEVKELSCSIEITNDLKKFKFDREIKNISPNEVLFVFNKSYEAEDINCCLRIIRDAFKLENLKKPIPEISFQIVGKLRRSFQLYARPTRHEGFYFPKFLRDGIPVVNMCLGFTTNGQNFYGPIDNFCLNPKMNFIEISEMLKLKYVITI